MLIRFFVFVFALSMPAMGQAKKDLNRYVRFLPLGNLYNPRPVLKNGIREHQPPKPGEAPPYTVTARGEVPQGGALGLTVNAFSRFAAFGPKVTKISLSDAKPGGKSWYELEAPAAKRSLAVLYRDHRKLNWFNTKSLVLKDDAKSFPLGSMRFVNVSDQMLGLTFVIKKKGQKNVLAKIGVPPGKVHVRELDKGGEFLKIVLLVGGEETELRATHQVKIDPDKRINAFFYKDSNPRPPKPIRMVFFPEKLPPLPDLSKPAKK